eukprot:6663436-Pyramimonas_sp.AAC.1
MTTASASRPWKESTEATSTPSAPGMRFITSRSRSTWAEYGLCTAMEVAGTPAFRSRATCAPATSASPSLHSEVDCMHDSSS